MRLSNRAKIPQYKFFLTIINITVFGGVSGFLLEIFKFNLLGNIHYLLLIVPFSLVTIFVLRGKQVFEYDSDGEAINFKNRNIVPFYSKVINDEFPKYKVVKYEIKNYILYKKLYLTITSKKKNFLTLKYDIAYLTRKEINDLKFSLNKICKNNRDKAKLEITK